MQSVLIFPALLFIILLIVQFALFLHARSVAEAAAQEAAAVARRADGTVAAATRAGYQALATLGPRMLTSQSVTVSRTATTVRVRVTGTGLAIVPGPFSWRVSETSGGTVERFVPEP